MSNAQRLIPFALGAVIVLLAANLLAGTRRPAEAGVSGSSYTGRNAGSEIGVRGPAAMPIGITALGMLDTFPNNDQVTLKAYVFRLWSDGTVDVNDVNDVAFVPGDGEQDFFGWLPLDDTLTGDITGPISGVPDGCVDSFDLNMVLAEWCSTLGGNPCGTCL